MWNTFVKNLISIISWPGFPCVPLHLYLAAIFLFCYKYTFLSSDLSLRICLTFNHWTYIHILWGICCNASASIQLNSFFESQIGFSILFPSFMRNIKAAFVHCGFVVFIATGRSEWTFIHVYMYIVQYAAFDAQTQSTATLFLLRKYLLIIDDVRCFHHMWANTMGKLSRQIRILDLVNLKSCQIWIDIFSRISIK